MFTLPTEYGLMKWMGDRGADVYTTASWRKEHADVENQEDDETCQAKVKKLVENGFDLVSGMNFCKPLRGRAAVAEIKHGAVRYYGGRIGKEGAKDIVVLDAAEDKDGDPQSDRRKIDRCEEVIRVLRKRFQEVKAAVANQNGGERGKGRR